MKKKLELQIDLSKPIDLDMKVDSECFGKEWEPQHPICSLCHSNPVCSIIFNQKTKLMLAALKAKRGGFLDETNFRLVNTDKLCQIIVQGEGTITFDQLQEAITIQSHCPDPETVFYWSKNWLTKNGFVLRNNKIELPF